MAQETRSIQKGDRAWIEIDNRTGGTMRFLVDVLETRKNYGRVDCRVTPAAGEGESWVQESRLAL